MTRFHILNGDSLLGAFPQQLMGERIVARECLVDGDVSGTTLEEFFATRAAFLNDADSDHDYYKITVPEFQKVKSIPDGSEVNLWFEDDLFCQVNLWFVCHLLYENNIQSTVYLIRPTSSLQYGFGGMTSADLLNAFDNRVEISPPALRALKDLWLFYQQGDSENLLKIANEYENRFPFLLPAIQAHIERIPDNGKAGRPERVLHSIMEELKTKEFGPVFREFCKREPIYGFGDLQVERMWRKIVERR